VAQYPFLVPPTIAIESTKAPDSVPVALGSMLMLPALGYLFYLFKVIGRGG
jgi:hypothetical protein